MNGKVSVWDQVQDLLTFGKHSNNKVLTEAEHKEETLKRYFGERPLSANEAILRKAFLALPMWSSNWTALFDSLMTRSMKETPLPYLLSTAVQLGRAYQHLLDKGEIEG